MEQQYSVFVYLQDKLIRVNFCPVMGQVEAFEYEYDKEIEPDKISVSVHDDEGHEIGTANPEKAGKW